MKTQILIFSSILIFSLTACAQSDKAVPAAIKSAFSRKFSGATGVKWGKESINEWEAEFKMDDKEYSANFDNSGTWMETEYEISAKEIPAVVNDAISKELPGYRINESEISETVKGKVYEFVLSKGREKMEAAFDINGTLISKESVKEENGKEEK